MYIIGFDYINVGPINKVSYRFKKDGFGFPVPLVIVGANGVGKSLMLSNIVDAFFEIACVSFRNSVVQNLEGGGHKYYKTISEDEIRSGAEFLLSKITFEHNKKQADYIFKTGKIRTDDVKTKCGIDVPEGMKWNENGHYKEVNATSEFAGSAFGESVICSFSPGRYAKPHWIGDEYYKTSKLPTFNTKASYVSVLSTPILSGDSIEVLSQWLFDVIADSRVDVYIADMGQAYAQESLINMKRWLETRKNIEKILSAIFCEDVVILMRDRFWYDRRLIISRKKDGSILVPALDAMSTGQLALFKIFATILKYAEEKNFKNGIDLTGIEGVVVIDEIELHLHPTAQGSLLPKLMRMFPRVQFVVTSHSPLFLLGLKRKYGQYGVDILEMPLGRLIDAEDFNEFDSECAFFVETKKIEKELELKFGEKNNTSLIVTEGSTDWRHIKAALQWAQKNPEFSDRLKGLNIEFYEYDSEEGGGNVEMGGSRLVEWCKYYSKTNHGKDIIFIVDRDVPSVVKEMSEIGKIYKSWGNRVFSICLPVPDFRKETPDICIELLYKDSDLCKTITMKDGIERRIYKGSEFNGNGVHVSGKYICHDINCYGKNKIIDGGEKNRKVLSLNLECVVGQNYALSKKSFAKYILEKEPPFDVVDFSGFVPLINTILEVLQSK